MDSFDMPVSAFTIKAIRLVRVNPLTLDPGALILMGARQLEGGKINQFPCYLEYMRGGDINWTRVKVEADFMEPERGGDV